MSVSADLNQSAGFSGINHREKLTKEYFGARAIENLNEAVNGSVALRESLHKLLDFKNTMPDISDLHRLEELGLLEVKAALELKQDNDRLEEEERALTDTCRALCAERKELSGEAALVSSCV